MKRHALRTLSNAPCGAASGKRLLPSLALCVAVVVLSACGRVDGLATPRPVDASMPVGAAPVEASAPPPSAPSSASSRRQALARLVAKCGVSPDHRPCVAYDPTGDTALLKDIRGQSQFLLLPISAIAGIESPVLLQPTTPNYLYAAWQQRGHVGAALDKSLPDADISLALNPVTARSQDHLHIHIDCVRGDVRDALRAAAIPAHWTRWSFGHSDWLVRRLSLEALRTENLFDTVARDVPGAAARMGEQTIFIAGVPAGDTPSRSDAASNSTSNPASDALSDVYVAVRRVALPVVGGANAEDLQDHDCGVASQRP